MSKFFDDTMQGLLEVAAMEYKQMQKEENGISDCLYIGVDFAPDDDGTLVVMRRKGTDTDVINQFRNNEALELYKKLIGEPYSICSKCIHHECAWKGNNVQECKYFEKE